MIVPVMSLGGKGVISVLANVLPEETHEMCQSFLDGNADKARKLQLDLLDLVNKLFIEVNPIPVKTALGLFKNNPALFTATFGKPLADNLQTIQALMDFQGSEEAGFKMFCDVVDSCSKQSNLNFC